MLRTSALADVVKTGRFGSDKGATGVTLSVVHPIIIIMAIARKGKSKALKDVLTTLKKAEVHWAGADQYYIYNVPYTEVKSKLEGLASVSDQSHGRVMLRIAGPKCQALLAKGTPVDLHPSEFPVGKSALTQMANVNVHLTRTGGDVFTLSVFRGFSESFFEWLTSQAAEFGYQVS